MGIRQYSAERFEDLIAWQKAIDLSVGIYALTRKYPKDELYGLTNQMRRASSSVSANLAEGYGRHSLKEKLQFYKIANGSLLETKSFCYLSERLEYLDKASLEELLLLIEENQRLINALIKSIRELNAAKPNS